MLILPSGGCLKSEEKCLNPLPGAVLSPHGEHNGPVSSVVPTLRKKSSAFTWFWGAPDAAVAKHSWSQRCRFRSFSKCRC